MPVPIAVTTLSSAPWVPVLELPFQTNATRPQPPNPSASYALPFPHPPFQPQHQHGRALSTGFWIGVAIFILFVIACFARYSYLASPFWFYNLKRTCWLAARRLRRLRRRQDNDDPLGRLPLYISAAGPGHGLHAGRRFRGTVYSDIIARPQPAYFAGGYGLRSTDTLPVYRPPTMNFSSDVLQALLSLDSDMDIGRFEERNNGGRRPPSYRSRSRLSLVLNAMETQNQGHNEQQSQQQQDQHQQQFQGDAAVQNGKQMKEREHEQKEEEDKRPKEQQQHKNEKKGNQERKGTAEGENVMERESDEHEDEHDDADGDAGRKDRKENPFS